MDRRDPSELTAEVNRRLNERAGRQATFFAWVFGALLGFGVIFAVAVLAGLR